MQVASKTNPLYTELARGTAKNNYNFALSDGFPLRSFMRSRGKMGASVSTSRTWNIAGCRIVVWEKSQCKS